MEVNDFDDLTTAQFQNHDTHDPEIKAANNHLLMKYFGNKLKHTNSPVIKKETFSNGGGWLSYMKPVGLSIFFVFLAILTHSNRVTQLLSFTSKDIVNKAILYGGLFIVTLIILIISSK